MDVLVSLGTNASYGYSMISILHHHFSGHHEGMTYHPTDFFETSAMLITFILLGKYLEASAKGRTSDAITALLTLTPPSALLLTVAKDGSVIGEEEVPTALIHRGDFLKVSQALIRSSSDVTARMQLEMIIEGLIVHKVVFNALDYE